jgi:hypothetical protein
VDSRHPAPRIIRIRYRSGINGRVATAYCKVPYGSLYDLSEKLARLMATQQVRWYRIDAATADEIEKVRHSLVRWPEALSSTVRLTRVNLEA